MLATPCVSVPRNITYGFSGVGYAFTTYACSDSSALIGYRLACKTGEFATYFGTQFIDH